MWGKDLHIFTDYDARVRCLVEEYMDLFHFCSLSVKADTSKQLKAEALRMVQDNLWISQRGPPYPPLSASSALWNTTLFVKLRWSKLHKAIYLCVSLYKVSLQENTPHEERDVSHARALNEEAGPAVAKEVSAAICLLRRTPRIIVTTLVICRHKLCVLHPRNVERSE